MTVKFSVEYITRWGERLCLVSHDKVYPMAWGAGNIWSVSIRGCTKELLEDYKDYLRTHDLPLWSKDDKAALAIRRLGRRKDESYETYRDYFEKRSDGTFANIMICLISQCNYLLDRQMRSQEQAFVQNGGIRERMHKARLAERNKKE